MIARFIKPKEKALTNSLPNTDSSKSAAEITSRYFCTTSIDETQNDEMELNQILSNFKELTAEKVMNMSNPELDIYLSKIADLDSGDQLEKPLFLWLAYFREFFVCHYNQIKTMSSTQREIAKAIILEYIPVSQKDLFLADFKNPALILSPRDVWHENKLQIKKLLENEHFENYDYLELIWEPAGTSAVLKIDSARLGLFRERKLDVAHLLGSNPPISF